MFWAYLRILSIPKNLRTIKTNFEKANGLGISEVEFFVRFLEKLKIPKIFFEIYWPLALGGSVTPVVSHHQVW